MIDGYSFHADATQVLGKLCTVRNDIGVCLASPVNSKMDCCGKNWGIRILPQALDGENRGFTLAFDERSYVWQIRAQRAQRDAGQVQSA